MTLSVADRRASSNTPAGARSSVARAAQWRSLHGSCSVRWARARISAPSTLAARLPPKSPRNQPPLVSGQTIGPVGSLTQVRRADVECRFLPQLAASCSSCEPKATGCCEARDAVPAASDDAAFMPPILQYSGAAMRLGRLYVLRLFRLLLALAFDLEKSSDMMGARLTKQKRARTASIQTHGPCRARRK